MAALALTLPWCVAGCGSSEPYPRAAVSGVVTLDGRPLDGAVIVFFPSGDGYKTGAQIVDGRFSIARGDGLAAGRHRVEILPYTPPDFSQMHGAQTGSTSRPPAPPPSIPERYNVASALFVTAVAGEENRFTFELTSK